MKGPRRRIFWSIYLNGLVIIVVVTLAVSAVTIFVQPEPPFHGPTRRLHQVLASELGRHIDRPEELQTTLDRLTGALERSGAVYHRDGSSAAASGAMPPPALNRDDLKKIGGWHPIHREKGGWVHAIPLGGQNGPYLLIEGTGTSGILSFIASLAAVLLVVALVSWPLARALAGPLERLTATSRLLAKGDLLARSGITRRDEVGELAQALDDMAMRLEQHIRNEKELFANISHEIRTPLARLRVALELLEDAPGDAQQTLQRLHGIGLDLTELELLVDNVLTSARLDFAVNGTTDIPLRPRPVVLDDFFAAVADRFVRHYPGQPFVNESATPLPAAVIDSNLLNRVCDNLLDNAVKYNTPGRPVILSVTANDPQFTVQVTDFGEGVAVEDLDRLFAPFFRDNRSRSRETGGAGLGLTLCKRIVEAHGGKITAGHNKEKGMTFSFEMPLTGTTKHGAA